MLRVWDGIVWICVVFPLLTGGVWIHRPGFKLELAELSAPVAIVAILGFCLARFGKIRVQDASSFKLAARLWERWRVALEARPGQTLFWGWLFFGTLWAAAALFRHWHFGSHAGDLGIFTSAIWNLVHDNGYVSSVKNGMNLFQDHQSPIFWLLAPAFRILPRPEILLAAQSYGLAAGAVALCGVARQLSRDEDGGLRGWGWAALPLLYWAYAPTRNANLFDFHPETLMLPCALAFVYFSQKDSWLSRLAAAAFLLLTLGAKESGGIMVAALGLAFATGFGRRRALGVLLIPIGIGAFLFDIKVVPGWVGGNYSYLGNYSSLGTGVGGLLLAPILKPVEFWSMIFQASRFKFLAATLGPLAFLPLANWRGMLIAAAGYLPLFLDPGSHRVGLGYHYSIEPSIGLFLAMPGALLWAQERAPLVIRRNAGVIVLFFAAVFFGRSEPYVIRRNWPDAHDEWLQAVALPLVKAPSVSASGALVPHLIQRPWVHHLPNIEIPAKGPVDCLVFDSRVNNYPLSPEQFRGYETGAVGQAFRLEYECGGFKVYRREGAEACLSTGPSCGGNI